MVESVDTRDLKSLGHCGRTGSSPVPGTIGKVGVVALRSSFSDLQGHSRETLIVICLSCVWGVLGMLFLKERRDVGGDYVGAGHCMHITFCKNGR